MIVGGSFPSETWSKEDIEILRQALLFCGVGNWSAILATGCLPGKTVGQLNSQTQRLLGQQSTAEFADLHLDVLKVGSENARRTKVARKGGIIVNTGRPLSKDEIRVKIDENRRLYEVEEAVWKEIKLPSRPFIPIEDSLASKKATLERLQLEQAQITEILRERKAEIPK